MYLAKKAALVGLLAFAVAAASNALYAQHSEETQPSRNQPSPNVERTAERTAERTVFGENLILENLPQSIQYTGRAVSDHMRTANTYRVRGWADDDTSLLFTRRGNLYKRRSPNHRYIELLDFEDIRVDDPQKAKLCGKDGFVFLSDKDGDEYDTLYAADGSTFKPTRLSGKRAQNRNVVVSPDRNKVAYLNALANTQEWRLYVQDICGGSTPIELHAGKARYTPRDFHPSNQYLLVSTQADGIGHKLSVFSVHDGSERIILISPSRISDAYYSKSGRYVFFTSRMDAEFTELYRFDLHTGELRMVIGNVSVGIETIVPSGDRTKMAVVLNRLGFSAIVVIDMEALSLVAPPPDKMLGVVSAVHLSHDGNKMAVRLSQPTVPSRSGTYDYRKDQFTPWTGGFEPGQKLIDLIPEATTYPTFDKKDGKQRRIPLLAFLPAYASKDNPAPVLISVHGGPSSQARPRFNQYHHYLVTKMGIAVLRPNIRGSTGYGESFKDADQKYKRIDAIRDIGALLDWIETREDLDASRIVIGGGSYGGFVAMASLVQYPDRFKGGISRVGITDFETFLKNTERYRVRSRRSEYGDERDPEMVEFFKAISPMHNANKIRAPVLIIQGARDPRVPQQQAEDMIKAMRNNGIEVHYLLAMDEGHGFKKSANARMSQGAQVWFLRKTLLDKN